MAEEWSEPEGIDRPPILPLRTLMGAIWAGFGIAVLFMLIRLYIRVKVFHRLFLDDGFVIAALCFLGIDAALYQVTVPDMYTIMHAKAGLEPMRPDILDMSAKYMKRQFAIIVLFWACLWAVKFAFLTFFWKLGNGLPRQRVFWFVVMSITVLGFIGCMISYPVACPSFRAEFCNTPLSIRRSLFSLRFSTALDVLTDILIILLPINLVWKVKMNLREKCALAGVFSLGGIIVIFAIVRVCMLNASRRYPELTWLALWTAIESSIAVTVSCLASFKTLFSRSRGKHYCSEAVGPSAAKNRQGIPLSEVQAEHVVTINGPAICRQQSVGSIEAPSTAHVRGQVHVHTEVEISRGDV